MSYSEGTSSKFEAELNNSQIISENSESEMRSPKKRKKSSSVSAILTKEDITDSGTSGISFAKKKKKKKRKHSREQSELETETHSETSVTAVSPKKKRKTASSYDFGATENSQHEIELSQYNGTNDQSDAIIKFLSSKPEYKKISIHTEKNATVDSNDEIWLLKCPSNIYIEGLENKELKLKNKSKIKVDDERFECFYKDEQQNYLTLAPKSRSKGGYTLRNILLQGCFSIKPKIPKINLNEDKIVQQGNQFIPLPETKRRHPFFGPDYEEFINIPVAVNDRRNPHSETVDNRISRKCKKERIQKETISEDSDLRKKKKKKRKISQEDTESPTPVKKVKKERSQVEDWGSERNIEENLFNC